jgi:UDP-2,3-diacylglucosamine pyrophosphatase LpxH
MLVFLSDLHLVDSSRRDLAPESFKKCAQHIRDTLGKANAQIRSVEVVLLGDVFDPLRSDVWQETTVRPWSADDARDSQGRTKHDVITQIVDHTCRSPQIQEGMAYITALRDQLDVPFEMTYILGNHDHMINDYPSIRVEVAQTLGMTDPQRFATEEFPTEKLWRDYRVVARHGHKFDPFGDTEGPTIWDAFTIDVMGRFIRTMADEPRIDDATLNQIRDVEFVRPHVDAPLWLKSLQFSGSGGKPLRKLVREGWNDAMHDFFRDEFVREKTRNMWFLRGLMEMGFHVIRKLSLHYALMRSSAKILVNNETSYDRRASEEAAVLNDEADFVVYGHTHKQKVLPLRSVNGNAKTYFNTGTWTKVYMRDAFGDRADFQSWQVMTFVTIFNQEWHNRYEVWNGLVG